MRPHPWRAIVGAAGGEAALVRGVDRGLAVGAEREVSVARPGLASSDHDPDLGAVDAVGDRVLGLDHAPAPSA